MAARIRIEACVSCGVKSYPASRARSSSRWANALFAMRSRGTGVSLHWTGQAGGVFVDQDVPLVVVPYIGGPHRAVPGL